VNAEYLLEQINIPTVFIVCDIKNNDTYWITFQGNKQIQEAYRIAIESSNDSLTIHIPQSNKLPATLDKMLEELARTARTILLRQYICITPRDYYEYIENQLNGDSIDGELRALKDRKELVEAKKLENLIISDKLGEAQKFIDEIVNNPLSSKRAKYYALLNSEKAFSVLKEEEDKQIHFYLWLGQELEKNTPDGDNALKYLAQSYKLYPELKRYISMDFNYYINSLIQKEQNDKSRPSLWLYQLEILRADLTKKIIEMIKQVDDLIKILLSEKHINVILYILPRFYMVLAIFRFRLLDEGFDESSEGMANWIKNKIKLQLELAKHIANAKEKDLALLSCIIGYTNLAHPKLNNEEYFKIAEELYKEISDKSIKEESQKIIEINRTIAKRKNIWDDDNPDWEGLKQMALEQSKTLGVNLKILEGEEPPFDDPKHLDYGIAQIVKIGIDDLDPTYILKNCKHMIFKYTGVIGEVGKMLGLNSAGMKQLGCILHPEYAHVGLSLKMLFSGLNRECEECPDREPHPEDWVFTYPWHKKQGEKYEYSLRQLREIKK